MTFDFDPSEQLVYITANIFGPKGVGHLKLALDTGASCSLINLNRLFAVGYEQGGDLVEVTTGSRCELAKMYRIERLDSLGHQLLDFEIVGLDLPESSGVDGLLGLDFFRGRNLNIDFRMGEIALN